MEAVRFWGREGVVGERVVRVRDGMFVLTGARVGEWVRGLGVVARGDSPGEVAGEGRGRGCEGV